MWKVLLWTKRESSCEVERVIWIHSSGRKESCRGRKTRIRWRKVDDVSPERREGLEVDGLQDVLGSVELQQQHDEDPVVRQLLKLRLTHVVVLNQHADDDTQHLEKQRTAQRHSQQSSSSQRGKTFDCRSSADSLHLEKRSQNYEILIS